MIRSGSNGQPDEREALAESEATRWLTRTLPAGAHMRPEGRRHVLLLWPYHTDAVAETFPLEIPDEYTELCLRGLTHGPARPRALPRPVAETLCRWRLLHQDPREPTVACPLPVDGALVHGALSGHGLMACMGAAELCAAHITGATLPDYAPAFDLTRYDDAEYLARLDAWGEDSQL